MLYVVKGNKKERERDRVKLFCGEGDYLSEGDKEVFLM